MHSAFCVSSLPTTGRCAQLAEGFDDEQQGTDFQQSRAVPALMDFEGSILDESLSTEKQRNPGAITKKDTKDFSAFSEVVVASNMQLYSAVCYILF